MDDFNKQAQTDGGLVRVMARFYGPYVLLLFDWTGAIITLMSLLFVVGWLRRTGELTAMLAAGVSHGRLLRPIVIASTAIILVQTANRELLLPDLRDALSMRSKDLTGDAEQAILPNYDKTSGILLEGKALRARSRVIVEPNFRLYGDYQGFGDLLIAKQATWQPASDDHLAGYLLEDVQRPERIDSLATIGTSDRAILMTSRDQRWLKPKQCFVSTTVHTDLLQTNKATTKLSSVGELVSRVRNPAVHSSMSLRVLLHERIIRTPLDVALVLLGLPLVVNRRNRNLFVMIGAAIGTVLFFFSLKTLAGAMGGSGYLLTPAMAAWVPLLVIGPVAYMRLREVQVIAGAGRSALDAGAGEVIVADGGSLDDTIKQATAAGATEILPSAPGRGRQLNRGARAASGDFVLFLHADNRLSDQCLAQMCDLSDAVWGAFRQQIDAPGLLYRCLESGNALRVRVRRMPFGDQAVFVRRTVLSEEGGVAEIPLMEDVVLARRLRRIARPVLLDGPVIVDPRRWRNRGVIRQTIVNWSIQVAYRLGVSPDRLAKWYR